MALTSPARLESAGLLIQRLRNNFALGSADEDWIPVVASRGWVILTRDVMIKRREAERQALLNAKAIVVMLRGDSMSAQVMADAVIKARPRLERMVCTRLPPILIHLQASGQIGISSGGERRGGRKNDT